MSTGAGEARSFYLECRAAQRPVVSCGYWDMTVGPGAGHRGRWPAGLGLVEWVEDVAGADGVVAASVADPVSGVAGCSDVDDVAGPLE